MLLFLPDGDGGDRDKSAGPRREPYASPQHQGFWETIDDSTMIALDITWRKEKGGA